MKSNFGITSYRDSDILHLKLIGDFDGASAFELLNTLKCNCPWTSKVFIHCSRLKEIHPFGISVFQNNLDVLKGQSKKLVFTGENAALLAPNEKYCIECQRNNKVLSHTEGENKSI